MLAGLLAAGHSVRVLARDPAAARKRLENAGVQGASPLVEFAAGDVVTGAGLDAGMAGCQAVVHLVGIIMEVKGATFDQSHRQATINVVEAARRQRMSRYVHMSALGARPDGVSGYQTSKWAAEEAVRASGIPFVILRPSIIFGPRDGFVTQMVQVMKTAPFVRPVPGHGRYRFRPVYVGDVVECFLQSLTSDRALGRAIELVGPDEITLAEMLAIIAECVGVKKPAVKVPFALMYMNAALLQTILPRPPVSTDQLRMLREGSTADPGPMLDTFKLNPTGFRQGLNKYLCRLQG